MKKNNIKISVIIPIYNAEKYLEKCIESIIKQSLEEIEIICVNDGSKDNSLKIINNLKSKDDRIIVINKKNGGSSSARNVALKIARGEYCLNIDSDDWIEQGYLEETYSKAKENNLDILVTDLIFDYQNNYQKNYIKKDLQISDQKILTGKEYIKIFFKRNRYGYSCNKLIKKELYTKNKFWYDEEIFLLEDLEILMMLSYFAKKVGKLNKAYYHYIQGENNGSYKIKIARLYDILICMNKLIDFFSYYNENEIVNLIKQDKYLHLLSRIVENSYLEKEEYKKFILKFVEEIKKEKKVKFEKEVLKNKYKLFLVTILKIIRIINKNLAFFVLKISKQIVSFNKYIKNN